MKRKRGPRAKPLPPSLPVTPMKTVNDNVLDWLLASSPSNSSSADHQQLDTISPIVRNPRQTPSASSSEGEVKRPCSGAALRILDSDSSASDSDIQVSLVLLAMICEFIL